MCEKPLSVLSLSLRRTLYSAFNHSSTGDALLAGRGTDSPKQPKYRQSCQILIPKIDRDHSSNYTRSVWYMHLFIHPGLTYPAVH